VEGDVTLKRQGRGTPNGKKKKKTGKKKFNKKKQRRGRKGPLKEGRRTFRRLKEDKEGGEVSGVKSWGEITKIKVTADTEWKRGGPRPPKGRTNFLPGKIAL